MHDLRIGFAGTPEFAAAHLDALLASDFAPVAVLTQPDRKAGRGKKLQASPVKALALEKSLPVFQPTSLKHPDSENLLKDLDLDVLIVVAYGLILPETILGIPRSGCINVHASLLPRWRGAAPIERAILAGDSESGVTIMQMDAGLDTGDMLYKVTVNIEDTDTRQDLEDKLKVAGKSGLMHTLTHFQELSTSAEKQDDSAATYASKIQKSEALIDFSLSAEEANRTVRAGIGRFPAYSFLNGERIRILAASYSETDHNIKPGTIMGCGSDSFSIACQNSSLAVSSIQLPGKKPVAVRDVLNSNPELIAIGSVFTMAESQ